LAEQGSSEPAHEKHRYFIASLLLACERTGMGD
jgi:hypothetical protein